MRPIVKDRVAWSVGLSVTVVSPTKTGEPIEMPFGLSTRLGPGNHVLDGGQPQIQPTYHYRQDQGNSERRHSMYAGEEDHARIG